MSRVVMNDVEWEVTVRTQVGQHICLVLLVLCHVLPGAPGPDSLEKRTCVPVCSAHFVPRILGDNFDESSLKLTIDSAFRGPTPFIIALGEWGKR